MRDGQAPPILSDAELREMFYGKPQPPRPLACDTPSAAQQFALWLVVIFGSWGVLYILWRIGADCLRRLGL